ncbi:glycosyltransferase family 4 protein [Roseibium sp. CAU 1637]|uniref:Glycosyltransferase family 4 protein n=1 Tax=Roseibium limicola TaxID=2816037 RepID=A0A939ERS9_9HYPH|nr:glycosyltransferase family 4 protein [Roseibium limicola]MBO0346756.1 glycosyltransferase family 4 protein [Roseibium limicola]
MSAKAATPRRKNAPVILQVIPDLVTGGAERTTIDVAAAIQAAGGTALVVSQGGPMVAELEAVGARHITLPVKSKNPITLLANKHRLQQLIRQENIALVHARSRAPAWSALGAARAENCPFVTTYHGIYNQSSAVKGLYNSVMARGDRVIANSRYTAALITDRHPFAEGRLRVIHRGSDLEALHPGSVSADRTQALAQAWDLPADPSERGPVIINMARLTAWKGQKILIDAAGELGRRGAPPVTVLLAGDAQGRDAYRAELQEKIDGYGLGGWVRLVGHCQDVPAALALADLAVVASVEPEAFGRAAVEAQAACVPVIVSDLGAVPETVLAPPEVPSNQRTGWRVPPGDAGALADAIQHALALPPQAKQELCDRGLAHARQHFSVGAMCRATLKVYAELL